MRLPLADPAGALGITARRQITFSSLFGVVAAPFNLLARFGEPYQHRVAAVPCLPCRGEDAKVTSRRSRPMKAATGDQFFGQLLFADYIETIHRLPPTQPSDDTNGV
jgi:hypothetical protein